MSSGVNWKSAVGPPTTVVAAAKAAPFLVTAQRYSSPGAVDRPARWPSTVTAVPSGTAAGSGSMTAAGSGPRTVTGWTAVAATGVPPLASVTRTDTW